MTSPTSDERTKRAARLLDSYLPLPERGTHPLVELLCDLMHWAEEDDLDFGTKVWEAQNLFDAEQRAIVPIPTPYRVKFRIIERYSTDIVATCPDEAVEAAQKLYAAEGASPTHGIVLCDSEPYAWNAEEVES